jgi:hypothetical protein
MFKWKVFVPEFGFWIEEGDWGRDVITKISSLDSILSVSLVSGDSNILISPQTGVINIGKDIVKLGILYEGYSYDMCNCGYTIEELSPMTTARFSTLKKESKDLERHFLIKYRINKIKEKGSDRYIHLFEPFIKEFAIVPTIGGVVVYS